MKPSRKVARVPAHAEAQIQDFIARFEPRHQKLIRGARRVLRRRFPTTFELAYDNYNFFVIGYSPTQRPSQCILTIAAAANGVGLCFVRGARLPDPCGILLGSGRQTRFIRLESAADLARPEVEALLGAAAERSWPPLRASGRGELILRSVSARRRPRRKSGPKG